MMLFSKISLRDLFLLTLGLLISSAFTFAVIGSLKSNAQSKSLNLVRLEVDDINQLINQSIGSPFYLSPRSADPCNPDLLDLVHYTDGWYIQYHYVGSKSITCEWTYYQNGEKIATDQWTKDNRKLASRIYYDNYAFEIAADTFFVLDASNRVACYKQRSYRDFNVQECYSESGILISIDPVDTFSQIPPMVYWFSYR